MGPDESKKSEENESDIASDLNMIDGEDLLWTEILKTLDKLEKGVEGDLSALGRATRNINRFRKRLPSTTWLRILHTIIPSNYKAEFDKLLQQFIPNKNEEQIKLISKLASVSLDDATNKLKSKNGDVFGSLMEFIAEKEKMAKIEIKKKKKKKKKRPLKKKKKKKKKKKEKNENENAMDIDSKEENADDADIENVKITL